MTPAGYATTMSGLIALLENLTVFSNDSGSPPEPWYAMISGALLPGL